MTESGQATAFDEWLSQASVKDLERELGEKERELTETLKKRTALEVQAQGLHVEVTRRKKMLEALKEVQPAHPHRPAETSPAIITTMSKREIAERILSESLRPMTPKEVRTAAIERGWLPNTPAAANQLSVAMNKAARQPNRRLHRDDDGRYSVPSSQKLPASPVEAY